MTAAAVRTRRPAGSAVLLGAGAARLAVLLAAIVLTAGCGDGGTSSADARPTPAAQNAATEQATTGNGPTPAPGGAATSGTFSSTDIGWIQLMLAMDDQAATLLDLVPAHSSDPRIAKWAKPVAADHRTDRAALRKLLSRARVPDTNPHEGHDMPGMVTEDELRTIKGTENAAFDALFLAAMREHLDQAARISHAQTTAGADPAAKKLAASVEKTSLAQRDRLPEAR